MPQLVPATDGALSVHIDGRECSLWTWVPGRSPGQPVSAGLVSQIAALSAQLRAIDFRDLGWAHVEQDLAHSIYGVTRGVDLGAGLAAFRAGYERIRPWPRLDLALLADVVAARRVCMVNVAVLLSHSHEYPFQPAPAG